MPEAAGTFKGLVRRLQRTLAGEAFASYQQAGGGYWAAAVALNLLLSLFPIMLAILFIASLLLRDPSSRDSVLHQLARVVPGGNSGSAFDDLTSAIDSVRQSTGLLGVLSLVGLLWSGSRLFGAIEAGFGALYGFHPRDFLPGKLMAFGMIFLLAVCVVTGIGASSAVALLTPIAEHSGGEEVLAGPLRWLVQVGAGVGAGMVLFGAMYVVVPRGKRRWAYVLPGAILAALAFEILDLAWPLYLHVAGGGNRYGQTFGLLLVIVSYVYLLAQILMLGAAVNGAVERRHGVAAPQPQAPSRWRGHRGPRGNPQPAPATTSHE